MVLALSVCMFSLISFAQTTSTQQHEPTDFMRSNGKVYVVVAVIVTIVTGLFIYLVNLDRKITKLENSSDKQ